MASIDRGARRAKQATLDLERASEAYANAEYEDSLTILDEMDRPDSESDLLRARACLRLFRNADVLSIFASRSEKGWGSLRPVILAIAGIALVRTGKIQEGTTLIDGAIAALSIDVAPEFRYEILYHAAQAAWARRDLPEAQRLAESIGRDGDVTRVRALDLLGFITSARGDLQAASRYHSLALSEYQRCVQRDEHVYGNLVSQVLTLAVELVDTFLRRQAEEHVALVRWTKAMDRQRYIVELYSGKLALLDGDAALAYERFENAVERADSAAHRGMALFSLADLERSLSETFASSRWYMKANATLKGITWSEADADQRMALVASTVSAANVGDKAGCASLVRYLSAAPSKGLPTAFSDDPRNSAYEAKARGHIALLQDKKSDAQTCFEKSYDEFRRLRMRYMSILVAAELRKLGSDRYDNELDEFTREYPNSIIADVVSSSSQLGDVSNAPEQASAPFLHKAEARVYSLICQGKSNATIAAELGKSAHTINNQTRRIFRTFNVRSRAALIADKVAREKLSRTG